MRAFNQAPRGERISPAFLEALLRIPNGDRKTLLFAWSALAEIGAAPYLYNAAASVLAPELAAEAGIDKAPKLSLQEQTDLEQALMLGRVRIQIDEGLRGGGADRMLFENAMTLARSQGASRSALHPLLMDALRMLARQMGVFSTSFPEESAEFCIEEADASELKAQAAPSESLKTLERMFRYMGASAALVEAGGKPVKLYVRPSMLREGVAERLLASLAGHEALRLKVRRCRTSRGEVCYQKPYSPMSFGQALMYAGVRKCIAEHPDLNLWPYASRLVAQTFMSDR